MSFGALSAPAKEALGRGATEVGTSTTTGDGGMTPEEREHSKTLVYQLLPSRYGMNPDDLRRADAIEVVVGQGAKPGGGGMLLGHKISDRVAGDARPAAGHRPAQRLAGIPDWTGPDDLEIKIIELREITDWEKPIFVKVGATRTYYDVQLAVKAGADVIVVDGMQGGTAATQDVFIEHVGIPTLPAVRLAVDALQELGMHRQVQLIVSGGIRSGADVAKALALGADAVSIGTAALIAMGDNSPELRRASTASSAAPPASTTTGRRAATRPASRPRTTSSPRASTRSSAAGEIANYLRVLTLETQTLARACGKSHVHNLEPEDLVALTVEAAAMARVPLAGHELDPRASAPRNRAELARDRCSRARGGAAAPFARGRRAEPRHRPLERDDRRQLAVARTRPAPRSRSAPARAPRRRRPSRAARTRSSSRLERRRVGDRARPCRRASGSRGPRGP